MRNFFKVLAGFLLVIIIGVGILMASNTVARRMVIYNFTDIDDYKIFPYHNIPPSNAPFKFTQGVELQNIPQIKAAHGNFDFDEYNTENETVAFLVIRNDSILLERYYNGYTPEMWVNSFSVAKSFVSALVGIAINEGAIKSVEEPITNYLPELKDKPGFDKVTIYHLLQQCSGIGFRESYYSPFSDAGIFYYGKDLGEAIKNLAVEEPPGIAWHYHSGNTQLLGYILKRATKSKSLTNYLHEKLWREMGNQDSISWITDEGAGMEKAFCCINSTALDFAKFGKLYLDSGKWNGKQMVPKEWVGTSINFNNNPPANGAYNYQWWQGGNIGDFMARGLNGQYIYLHPTKNLIVVRLGKRKGDDPNWPAIIAKFCTDIN